MTLGALLNYKILRNEQLMITGILIAVAFFGWIFVRDTVLNVLLFSGAVGSIILFLYEFGILGKREASKIDLKFMAGLFVLLAGLMLGLHAYGGFISEAIAGVSDRINPPAEQLYVVSGSYFSSQNISDNEIPLTNETWIFLVLGCNGAEMGTIEPVKAFSQVKFGSGYMIGQEIYLENNLAFTVTNVTPIDRIEPIYVKFKYVGQKVSFSETESSKNVQVNSSGFMGKEEYSINFSFDGNSPTGAVFYGSLGDYYNITEFSCEPLNRCKVIMNRIRIYADAFRCENCVKVLNQVREDIKDLIYRPYPTIVFGIPENGTRVFREAGQGTVGTC